MTAARLIAPVMLAALSAALLSGTVAAQTPTSPASPPAQPAPVTSAPAQAAPATPAAAPAAQAWTPIVQPTPQSDMVATLRASGRFTTLLKALDAANLTSVVQKTSNLTLFAPTDAAFAALPAGQLDTLLKTPSQLQPLLAYHLLHARVTSAEFQGKAAGQVTTVANKPLTINGTANPVTVGDANLLQADILATNGVIHVIDRVLTSAP